MKIQAASICRVSEQRHTASLRSASALADLPASIPRIVYPCFMSPDPQARPKIQYFGRALLEMRGPAVALTGRHALDARSQSNESPKESRLEARLQKAKFTVAVKNRQHGPVWPLFENASL